MKIQFYGVRGSIASPSRKIDKFYTIKYGGNTTCVTITKEVDGKIKRIVIDCGTGAYLLGKEIVNNYFSQPRKEDLDIVMLFTHLHPDHTQGFPFFAPNYFKECNLNIMGMKALKKHIGRVLEQTMLPPIFPIEYKDLKSNRKHFELKDGAEIDIHTNFPNKKTENDRSIFLIKVMQAYAPSHPQQGAIYYKITDPDNGRSVACIWDLESKQGGDKAVIQFAKDCDVMIHDTQYTKEEYEDDKVIVQGFGHSTYDMAINNASQAQIKSKLICTHFNPAHSDEVLDSIQKKLSSQAAIPYSGFDVILAREGIEIEV